MNDAKRKALEAAGWKVGDAADFLVMNEAERQLLDVRVRLALAVRRQCEASRLSQKELGQLLATSQPRIAKIERAAPDVSLDQLVKAFAAAGGKFEIQEPKPTAKKQPVGKGKASSKQPVLTATIKLSRKVS
jgi:predicted XRE-type DNA-binding protein